MMQTESFHFDIHIYLKLLQKNAWLKYVVTGQWVPSSYSGYLTVEACQSELAKII